MGLGRICSLFAGVCVLGFGVVVPAAPAANMDADFHTLRTPQLGAGEFELLTLSTMPDTVSARAI